MNKKQKSNIGNKILSFLFTTIIVLVSGYFIYQSYNSYKTYQIKEDTKNYLFIIEDLNRAIHSIEEERLKSAIYLGANGKIDFKDIKKSRDKTDDILNKIDDFKNRNIKFFNDLQYVRSRVDVINDDYKSILFSYYQDEISSTILKEIKSRIKQLSIAIKDKKINFKKYIDLIEYKNRINREKSFIAYILKSSKKMDDEDLLIWEDILKNDISSHYKSIYNQRLAFAKGLATKNYQINLEEWLNANEKIEDTILYSQKRLYNQIQSQMTDNISYPKELIYNSTILLILLLILYKIFKKRKVRRYTDEVIIQNQEIVRKMRATDKPKTEAEKPQHNQEVIHKKRATDIPLTNINIPLKSHNQQNMNSTSTQISFNPVEEFARVVNILKEETSKKDISFIYTIDPTIPTHCIGEIKKIDEALSHLINYTIKSSNYKTIIKLNIENLAQTKVKSAISFSINQNNSHFSEDEIKKIHSAKHPSIYDEIAKTVKLNPAKKSLVEVSKIVSEIDGNFKIVTNPKNITELTVTINLKRE